MPKTEAAKKAQQRYVHSEKGKSSLKKARQKIADTDEYRAYQRDKQREYRLRRKLAANGEISTNSDLAVEKLLRLPAIKVVPEIEAAIALLPDTSGWLRRVITEAVEKELLPVEAAGSLYTKHAELS